MDAQDLCRQAAKLHQSGNSADAERLYLQALALNPGNVTALHLLGVLRSQAGRKSESQELIGPALALPPAAPVALMHHGMVLQEMGRPQEALLSYDRALALKPDYVPVLQNRSGVLMTLGHPAEALASQDRAAAAAPGDAAVWKNRGHLLRLLDRSAAALASYDRALAIDPDDPQSWDDRGAALHLLKRFEGAMASFDRAIGLRADYAPAWFHKALGFLLLGQLEQGWPLLEWRHRLPGAAARSYAQPLWTGTEDIAGKTLFVWWEEGLGDVLQYFRFVLAAAARDARVIFSAPAAIRRLLEGADAPVEIVGPEAAPSYFDCHIGLLSLPLAFGTRLATIPAAPAYLHAEAERVKVWAEKIGGDGFRIGVIWATTASRSLGRSFALRELVSLAGLPGVRLIALQKHDGLEELDHLPPGMTVESHHFDEGDDAFLDTAAMMENMDLIITADTSTAHLAGALGRPVWIALKYVADWRWFLGRTDSPWYPSALLFRQEADGDWASVFARMKAELAARL